MSSEGCEKIKTVIQIKIKYVSENGNTIEDKTFNTNDKKTAIDYINKSFREYS